ncbi:hypothetical protein QFZ82_007574 [Streptomyces sp. V4I23]|uniref:hypothetical protein n=1 Tax=Streptomyces sp. V4I23 TaxID=3042282 RepID=UPI00277D4E3A|nr:hypothetical protein [Streptomyces sp. V4I23]MDQ1013089.1 hypothetical protein [Streptomyces sp. V4I23]
MKDHPDGIVLVSDPWATAVSLKDCEEKPVDCRGLLRVDSRRSDPYGGWARLCVGVAERLGAAGMLLSLGRRRLLVEGCRPPVLQYSLFEGYAAKPRALQSDADEDEIHTGTSRCSAPAGTTRRSAGASAAGMVNCVTKWWHWSYRDRSRAWCTTAVYGPVERERAA